MKTQTSACLTRVSLAYMLDRISHYLRFGSPYKEQMLDRSRAFAWFKPGDLFGYIRWQAGDYGTLDWRLFVCLTGQPEERLTRVRGIRPSAHILLNANGKAQVQRFFTVLDTLEEDGFDPAELSPDYYRHCHNRIQAGAEIHPYRQSQHQAWALKRELHS